MTTSKAEKKIHAEMSCADYPVFLFLPMQNYQLDTAFAFSQITRMKSKQANKAELFCL